MIFVPNGGLFISPRLSYVDNTYLKLIDAYSVISLLHNKLIVIYPYHLNLTNFIKCPVFPCCNRYTMYHVWTCFGIPQFRLVSVRCWKGQIWLKQIKVFKRERAENPWLKNTKLVQWNLKRESRKKKLS